MGDNENDEAKNRTRKLAVFALVGGLLVVVAWLLDGVVGENSFAQNVLTSLGIVLVAVVAVEFVWSLLGGEPLSTAVDNLRSVNSNIERSTVDIEAATGQLQHDITRLRSSVRLLEASYASGLRWATANSGDWGSWEDWMALLRSGKNEVDLLGHTLQSWRAGKDLKRTIVDLAKSGCQIRVVTMDLENSELGSAIEAGLLDVISIEETRSSLAKTLEFFSQVSKEVGEAEGLTGSFEIRTLHHGQPPFHMVRVDQRMLALPYLSSIAASSSPLLDIEGRDSSLYRAYLADFDAIWRAAREYKEPAVQDGDSATQSKPHEPSK
jgi:xanthosine utilization system XapX-like protein